MSFISLVQYKITLTSLKILFSNKQHYRDKMAEAFASVEHLNMRTDFMHVNLYRQTSKEEIHFET
jgi:hypothetical protein